MIYHGDCLEVLRTLPDCSVDAVVTDPPYGLSFMGKKWDYDVPSVEVWAECLRVLKPGGHLLAFAGTRTQHRMAVRIEDAGFEIRDMIAWVYSQGFPKSMNLDRQKGGVFCGCEGANEPAAECGLRSLRDSDVPAALDSCEGRGEVLQPGVSEQGAPVEGRVEFPGTEVRRGQPGVEGWGNTSPSAGELRSGEVRESAGLGGADGAQGRLRDGAPLGDGEGNRADSSAPGSRSSLGPQASEQRTKQLGALAGQPIAQTGGAWPVCGGCGKPRIPSGLGTALKPALEPITVARKPLIGTVAENVLAHGVGAMNIDECRVATDDNLGGGRLTGATKVGDGWDRPWMNDPDRRNADAQAMAEKVAKAEELGRWPANLIHDGSEEVLAGFPTTTSGGGDKHGKKPSTFCASTNWEAFKGTSNGGDTGSAARFFYCAKASKRDRDEGLEGFDIIIHLSQSNDGELWDQEENLAQLRVVMDNSRPKVIAASGALNRSVIEWNMLLSGNKQTGQCQQSTIFTTETGTSSTTESKILSCFLNLLTSESMADANFGTGFGGSRVESVEHGIEQITITNVKTESALGVERAAFKTRLRISVREARNNHVTVKPTDLMRYLCRLVTPPGGTVLDPFMGSGSTGKAAVLEGLSFIGIEREAEYVEIAKARIAAIQAKPKQEDLF